MILKRVAIFFIACILCGAIGSAQNINVYTYEKLVDYVNCKYMVVYVKANLSNDPAQHKLSEKLRALKECSLNDLHNIPDFEIIMQALRPDAESIKPQARAKSINKIKEKKITGLNNEAIVRQILSEFSNVQESQAELFNCIKSIENDLTRYFNIKNPVMEKDDRIADDDQIKKNYLNIKFKKDSLILSLGERSELKYDIISKDVQRPNLQFVSNNPSVVVDTTINKKGKITVTVTAKDTEWGENENERRATITVKIRNGKTYDTCEVIVKKSRFAWFHVGLRILGLGFLLLFAYLAYLALMNPKDFLKELKGKTKRLMNAVGSVKMLYIKEDKKNNNDSGNRIEELEMEIVKLNAQIKKLLEEKSKLTKDNDKLTNSIEQYKQKKNVTETTVIKEEKFDIISETGSPTVISTSILFADAIIDGFFYKITDMPNEDTIYELHLHNAQSAVYTIYDTAYQRIISRPSFLDGCDTQVLINAQNVIIENEGTAQRQADGRWKIIKKLNVIIK